MQTPVKINCHYFYGNYYRGRQQEECRLIGNQQPPGNWTRDLCKHCPVPGIIRANACTNMVLNVRIQSGFLNFNRRVIIDAICTKTQQPVSEPEIGCGECHPLPSIFFSDDQTIK